MKRTSLVRALWLGWSLSVGACAAAPPATPAPPVEPRAGRLPDAGIAVGFEYALLDNEPLVIGIADAFGAIGLTGMKHYV